MTLSEQEEYDHLMHALACVEDPSEVPHEGLWFNSPTGAEWDRWMLSWAKTRGCPATDGTPAYRQWVSRTHVSYAHHHDDDGWRGPADLYVPELRDLTGEGQERKLQALRAVCAARGIHSISFPRP